MKTIFNEQQINFMKENYLTMSYKDIADILGFTERQIRGKLNNMGLTKLRKINDHYFDVIDTSLKAYFLGFIFADGWLINNPVNRNYELGMELQSEDRYILEKLNEELGGQNIIYHSQPTKRIINGQLAHIRCMDCLRIYSKNIVQGLINHGVVPNKTQKDIYPVVDNEFFFDFLRGYIDGDGCFYTHNSYTNMHITCSSKVVLDYLKNRLSCYDICTHVYQEKDKKFRLVCCNDNSMKKLVNHLYYSDDLFCLQRKYIKIKTLINGFAV